MSICYSLNLQNDTSFLSHLALLRLLELRSLLWFQVNLQRTLLPDQPRLETFSPVAAFLGNLEVKVP